MSSNLSTMARTYQVHTKYIPCTTIPCTTITGTHQVDTKYIPWQEMLDQRCLCSSLTSPKTESLAVCNNYFHLTKSFTISPKSKFQRTHSDWFITSNRWSIEMWWETKMFTPCGFSNNHPIISNFFHYLSGKAGSLVIPDHPARKVALVPNDHLINIIWSSDQYNPIIWSI